MTIEIFSTDSNLADQTAANVLEALRAIGQVQAVQRVDDISQMIARGIPQSPALVINGRIKSIGRVPKVPEVICWLQESGAARP